MWLEGWSLCLSEMNYLRTGYKTEGLLDVKIVTDADFANALELRVEDRGHHGPGEGADASEDRVAGLRADRLRATGYRPDHGYLV